MEEKKGDQTRTSINNNGELKALDVSLEVTDWKTSILAGEYYWYNGVETRNSLS